MRKKATSITSNSEDETVFQPTSCFGLTVKRPVKAEIIPGTMPTEVSIDITAIY